MKTSYKFDNVMYSIGTWYKHTDLNTDRNFINILNNGVNNDSIIGLLYVSFRTDDTTETATLDNGGIITLKAGDSISKSITADTRINIQANKLNICVVIEERNQEDHVTLVSSG